MAAQDSAAARWPKATSEGCFRLKRTLCAGRSYLIFASNVCRACPGMSVRPTAFAAGGFIASYRSRAPCHRRHVFRMGLPVVIAPVSAPAQSAVAPGKQDSAGHAAADLWQSALKSPLSPEGSTKSSTVRSDPSYMTLGCFGPKSLFERVGGVILIVCSCHLPSELRPVMRFVTADHAKLALAVKLRSPTLK